MVNCKNEIEFCMGSSFLQKINRFGQHLLGRVHDRQVGLERALRFAHVHDFDQGIDIGHFHIAAGVGGGVEPVRPTSLRTRSGRHRKGQPTRNPTGARLGAVTQP